MIHNGLVIRIIALGLGGELTFRQREHRGSLKVIALRGCDLSRLSWFRRHFRRAKHRNVGPMFEPDEINDTGKHIESMRSLMEGLVQALVDSEDSVVVEAIPVASGTAFVIAVATEDIGKVISKEGRTARSLRTILAAASKRCGHSFSMDLRQSA